jgi:hypothetical protein
LHSWRIRHRRTLLPWLLLGFDGLFLLCSGGLPHNQISILLLTCSLIGWLVADGWCWFVLREEYCWLVAGGWFIVREKYCWLVADKPSEQGDACAAGGEVTPPSNGRM